MPRKVRKQENDAIVYVIDMDWLADILETLKKGDKQVPIEVIRRSKDVEENINLYKPIIEELDGVSVMQPIKMASKYSRDIL